MMPLNNISRRSLLARLKLLSVSLVAVAAVIICASEALAVGTLDPTFGNNGEASFSLPISPWRSAIQPDGKIVIVSPWASSSRFYSSLTRYNSDGTLDLTFGRHGRASYDSSNYFGVWAIAIQPDGKIVLAGSRAASTPYSSDMMLARFNADGSPDTSFGQGGTVVTDLSDREEIHAVAVQPDGKIVVAGSASFSGQCGFRFVLGRYTDQGLLDINFGRNGFIFTPFGNCNPNIYVSFPEFNAVSINPDGKILVGGKVSTDYVNYVVAQFSSSGTMEFFKSFHSFQEDSPGFNFISKLPDGKILAIGEKVARFLSNGELDPSFPLNDQLAQRTSFYNGNGALLPDGKILFHTSFSPLETNVDYVRVLSRNGGVIGEIRREQSGYPVANVLAQADGKIILLFQDKMSRYLDISSLAGRQTDFDGDYKSDIGYFRPVDGTWAVRTSTYGEVMRASFGLPGDYPTPGSFYSSFTTGSHYGGSRALVAVYRPSAGVWYVNRMCGDQVCSRALGEAGAFPVGGDYDGDGLDDFAVFKDGMWHVSLSYTGSQRTFQWGTAGDQPVPGDYDYDGFTDWAVYRPGNGTWYVSLSSSGNSLVREFGSANDLPVPGDYDGDGRTDLAVFRPQSGTWYMLNSRDGSLSVQQFGISTDRPVPGDYDGDGITDIAVFRNGFWYLLRSSGGFGVVKWGATDAVPLTPGYTAH